MKEKGKLPPQAIELEEAILGAMMIDKKGIEDVIDILFTDVFYKPEHQLIYKSIFDLYRQNKPIDLLTISDDLVKIGKLQDAGGDMALINLTQKVSSSAHIEYHSRIVLQKYIQRKLIDSSAKTIEQSYRDNTDVFDSIDLAYNNLNEIAEIAIKKQEQSFGSYVDLVIDKGVKIYNKEITAGLKTPIKVLTEKTGGWRNSELIILAARPGMGKTSFALSCVLELAKQNIPVAFFSLEMSNEQLTSRLLSMEYKIDGKKFNNWGLNQDDYNTLQQKSIADIPLVIDDTASLSIEQFQVKAKRLKSKHNIQMIVVDYLQLMTSIGRNGSREQEISKISRGLKLVAKELDIPVIALSQLSRAVETRGGSKRPMLSDLRESGAIEQDADVVGFFFRPEYYGLTEWDDDTHENCIGQADISILKNRNGGLVQVRMNFEGRFTLFSDIDNNNDDDNFFDEIKQEQILPKPEPKDVFQYETKRKNNSNNSVVSVSTST
jgi:replicative DNA helicase